MSKAQKGWATFGKVSAVIATIGTIGTLYLAFFPAKPKLVAVGHYHEHKLPPDFLDAIESLRSATSAPSLNTFFNGLCSTNNASINFKNYKIASALSKHFKSSWPEKFHYRSSHYGGFVYLVIKNRGNREASDIIMELPNTGIALVTATDDTQSTQAGVKRILLGNLRPHNSKYVALWLTSNVSRYDEEKFIITHADGIGKVRFGRVYSGLAQFMARFYLLILWMLLIVGLWIWQAIPSKSTGGGENSTSNN